MAGSGFGSRILIRIRNSDKKAIIKNQKIYNSYFSGPLHAVTLTVVLISSSLLLAMCMWAALAGNIS